MIKDVEMDFTSKMNIMFKHLCTLDRVCLIIELKYMSMDEIQYINFLAKEKRKKEYVVITDEVIKSIRDNNVFSFKESIKNNSVDLFLSNISDKEREFLLEDLDLTFEKMIDGFSEEEQYYFDLINGNDNKRKI